MLFLLQAPLSSVLGEFDAIQKEQKEFSSCTDKRDWWLGRTELDRRMKVERDVGTGAGSVELETWPSHASTPLCQHASPALSGCPWWPDFQCLGASDSLFPPAGADRDPGGAGAGLLEGGVAASQPGP